MYPDDATIRTRLIELLHNIAPGFELLHYQAEPMHDHLQVQVCAREGLNRLVFETQVYKSFATQGRLSYIGTATIIEKHRTGISNHAKLLIDAYPDAHVQHYDNEEDGVDALFGYVAYDDNFRPLAWSPMPLDEDGEPPVIAHTMPDLTECMNYIRADYYRKTNRGI